MPTRITSFLPVGAACLVVALVGCAQGSNGDDDDSPIDAPRIDAGGDPDGPETDGPLLDAPDVDAAAIDAPDIDATPIDATPIDGAVIDGAVIDGGVIDGAVIDGGVVIDARPIDASPIDATPIDGPPLDAPCSPTTTQLLVNPAFDANPVGTGWTETPINAMYPLITGDDGIPEHTAPYKAWLGGLEAPNLSTVTDTLYQQVTVPAGTTQLVVRGMYEVRTAEAASTMIYDSSRVDLTNASGVVLENVLTVGNPNPTTAWTQFQRTFTLPYAGQAVRLRFQSTNDYLDPTSFYYDTIVLEATRACP